MTDWTPQTWISFISAVVSVIGAATTLYLTRKKMRWDAGRELGGFRRDTLALISDTMLLDDALYPTSVADYAEARSTWARALVQHQPLIGPRTTDMMRHLFLALNAVERDVFGDLISKIPPERNVERQGSISPATRTEMLRIEKVIVSDPTFMTR